MSLVLGSGVEDLFNRFDGALTMLTSNPSVSHEPNMVVVEASMAPDLIVLIQKFSDTDVIELHLFHVLRIDFDLKNVGFDGVGVENQAFTISELISHKFAVRVILGEYFLPIHQRNEASSAQNAGLTHAATEDFSQDHCSVDVLLGASNYAQGGTAHTLAHANIDKVKVFDVFLHGHVVVECCIPGTSTVQMQLYLMLLGVLGHFAEVSGLDSTTTAIILRALQTDACNLDLVHIDR